MSDLLTQLYFQEISERDRINTRAQIHMAAYATLLALLAYMSRRLDYLEDLRRIAIFWVFEGLAIVLLMVSIVYTVRAMAAQKYWVFNDLSEQKKAWHKGHAGSVAASFDEHLANQLPEYFDKNAALNDSRTNNLFMAFNFLLASAVPMVFASAIFIVFDLDASSPRKIVSVQDKAVSEQLNLLNHYLRERAR